MTAPALVKVTAPDPMVAVRTLNRMKQAGFTLELENDRLMVEPLSRMNDAQRADIRAHKPALVVLLQDAETLHAALVQAGPAGLGWMEGTPADWTSERLLAADEALYSDGRMVSVYGRSYLKEHAPPFAWSDDAQAVETAP